MSGFTTTPVSDSTTTQDTVSINNRGWGGSYAQGRRYKSGSYYGSMTSGTPSTIETVNGTVNWVPFEVYATTTFDRIGVEVTTAGSAGSVIRLAVYRDTGDGMPGTLIDDVGTVDSTSTGWKELNLDPLVLGPGLYWTYVVSQGIPTTKPWVRCLTNATSDHVSGLTDATTAAPVPQAAYTKTGQSGAAQGTAGATGVSSTAIRVMLRAA